jgi:DnaJ-class molecular chaperone
VQLKLSDNEKVALKVMELQIDDLNEIELKKAYKKAVKKYHPDINLTNKNSEEIFKIISTAYKSLLGKITK